MPRENATIMDWLSATLFAPVTGVVDTTKGGVRIVLKLNGYGPDIGFPDESLAA
jgi:hypothetical protein